MAGRDCYSPETPSPPKNEEEAAEGKAEAMYRKLNVEACKLIVKHAKAGKAGEDEVRSSVSLKQGGEELTIMGRSIL